MSFCFAGELSIVGSTGSGKTPRQPDPALLRRDGRAVPVDGVNVAR